MFSTSAQHYARASALQKRAQLRMGEIVRAWDESELFKLNETKNADNHVYTRILRDLHRGSKHDGDVFDSSAGLPPPLNKDGVAPDVYLSQHFAEVFKAQAPPLALDDPTLAAGIAHAPSVAEPCGAAINAPLDAHELNHYLETLKQATEGGPRGHYCSPSSPQFTDPSSVKPQPERQHRHYSTPSCPQHSSRTTMAANEAPKQCRRRQHMLPTRAATNMVPDPTTLPAGISPLKSADLVVEAVGDEP